MVQLVHSHDLGRHAEQFQVTAIAPSGTCVAFFKESSRIGS